MVLIGSKTSKYRTIFVLVIITPSGNDKLAQKKTIEKCAYCNSKDIQHPTTTTLRQNVTYFLNVWFSSNCKREKIEKCECVGCCKCHRDYQKTNLNDTHLPTLQKSIPPLDTALQNFRDIFGNVNFNEWVKHVLTIVFTESGAMHIIFRICRIRAYLDCQKIQGRFVIISVEMLF
jgi:hypothetical protein